MQSLAQHCLGYRYVIGPAILRVDNESHDRHPRSSLKDDNFRAVYELIEGEQRLTVDEIATDVSISHGRTHAILVLERFVWL